MNLQRNYYQVLGIEQNASTEEIKKKYRELARKFHPDLAKDKALAQKVFTQINQAYRTLADAERRNAYDMALIGDARKASTSGPGSTRANGVNRSLQAAIDELNTGKPSGGAPAYTIRQMLSEADVAIIQGKFNDGKNICEKVLQLDPNNATAYGILGDALTQMNRPQDAVQAYRNALRITPSTLIQSKLDRLKMSRLTDAALAEKPKPPNGTANGKVNSTKSSTTSKTEPGLFSRLFGRK